jgi:hypothetical protein
MLLYSIVPLIGLALLNHKYAERQSRLERQYQGRIDAAERSLKLQNSGTVGESGRPAENAAAPPPPVEYSTPDDTIIPLTPLTLIFVAVAGFAAVMLARERRWLNRGGLGDSSHGTSERPSP